jgi:hypothetical protein
MPCCISNTTSTSKSIGSDGRQIDHHGFVVEQAGHGTRVLRQFVGELGQIGRLQHQRHQRQRRAFQLEARGVDVAADYGAHEVRVKMIFHSIDASLDFCCARAE